MGVLLNVRFGGSIIAEVCEEAGFLELDDLVMAYKRDGEYVTVTRSVTIEMLKDSPALRLAPAEVQRKAEAASGKAGGGGASGSGGKKAVLSGGFRRSLLGRILVGGCIFL